MCFYLCFIIVVLKLVFLLMFLSFLLLIILYFKKFNLFFYLLIFYCVSFFIILSGIVFIYININFGFDDEIGDIVLLEVEEEGLYIGRRNKLLDWFLYGNYVGKIGKF